VRIAIAGLGNNASALLQGIELCKSDPHLHAVGLARPKLHNIGVDEVDCVLAFDTDPGKIGLSLAAAVRQAPNNFPLVIDEWRCTAVTEAGIPDDGEPDRRCDAVARSLEAAQVDVLLLSLPTGLDHIAVSYARAALAAGVAVVNCSADHVARVSDLMRDFRDSGLPLLGDDLASQFGSSLLHRAVLDLLVARGLALDGSYQVNIGGNEDFRNLLDHGANKLESKMNVLRDAPGVTVVPSAGYVPFLEDRKVAHIRIEGRGWLATPVTVDLRLEVQDSSNAAGVIIDLVRIAAHYREQRVGGLIDESRSLLKSSPPGP
jgi:myo-inositol-1-phosphate synthase